jgi:hypothetical protein
MSNGGEAPPDLPGSEDVGLDEDSSTEDSSAREVLLEETRRQLDRQAAEVEHIDNKAAKTVRYTLLGLAALATAFSFGPNTPKINKIIGLGVFVLLASVCVGVFTYTASRVYVAAPTVLEVDVEGESAFWRRVLSFDYAASFSPWNRDYGDWSLAAITQRYGPQHLETCALKLYVESCPSLMMTIQRFAGCR